MKPLLAAALGAFLFCSAADNGGDEDMLWISSTGKTHNSSCRYYGMGKGRFTRQGSGNNCKFCGGDKPLTRRGDFGTLLPPWHTPQNTHQGGAH